MRLRPVPYEFYLYYDIESLPPSAKAPRLLQAVSAFCIGICTGSLGDREFRKKRNSQTSNSCCKI